MAEYLDAIVDTLKAPDGQHPEPGLPGRERFFRRGVGPRRWMRVVVEFRGDHDRVVTAFGHDNDPPEQL